MEMQDILSSYIRKAGYDAGQKRVHVEFTSKVTGYYNNVTQELYDEFMLADSKGKFLRDKIINHGHPWIQLAPHEKP
jgi:hypothetical protein